MEEKFVLYALTAISILIAAVLLIYRSNLLSRLSDKQIKLIFGSGQETEIELKPIEKTVIKMKTRFPALVFLIPAIVFAILAQQTSIVKKDWIIKGKYTVEDNVLTQINWSEGVLTIHPTDIKKKVVGQHGDFEIKVAIPVGTTFEEEFEFVEYVSFDQTRRKVFRPGAEFKKYEEKRNGESILSDIGETSRFYDEVPVQNVPLRTIEASESGGG